MSFERASPSASVREGERDAEEQQGESRPEPRGHRLSLLSSPDPDPARQDSDSRAANRGSRVPDPEEDEMRKRIAALTLTVVLSGARSQPVSAEDAGLSANDRVLIRQVVEAYRKAWLGGDAEGVLSTLTEDCVLLPGPRRPRGGRHRRHSEILVARGRSAHHDHASRHYGRRPVGRRVAREFLRTRRRGLDHGGARQGVVQGHPGTSTSTKSSSGEWRIARHMWGDGPPRPVAAAALRPSRGRRVPGSAKARQDGADMRPSRTEAICCEVRPPLASPSRAAELASRPMSRGAAAG